MRKDKVFVHESAFIDNDVSIGKGTKIWHFSHIMEDVVIGENCRIGQNVFIGKGVIIGNNVKIQNNVSLYSGLVLEDNVFCGPSVVFTNVINPRSHISRKNEFKKTYIKKGGTLGANATIICGTTIGEYAFVGAGALISKDIPDFALVYGNPARIKGWMCACGTKLNLESGNGQCNVCGEKYTMRDGCLKMYKHK